MILIVSLIIALILPYIREKESFNDTDIALNQLELNYNK
jgi:hypothetical protein